MKGTRKRNNRKRGYVLVTTFAILGLLAIGGVSYVNSATQTVRVAYRQELDIETTHLCEAGVQAVLRNLWRPFKITQQFTGLESSCNGASENSPVAMVNGTIPGVGRYSAGVISMQQPNGDTYSRLVRVRAVGWQDLNGNGQLDEAEPRKTVDVNSNFQLTRSQVFDYTYFVNNYGWMDGFSPTQLYINGDSRANGNFNFLNGSPTCNGSILACMNEKLSPAAAGTINTAPVKMNTSSYASMVASTSTPSKERMRQVYDSTKHGERGSDTYEQWRDVIFDPDASIVKNRLAGAFLGDVSGYKSWQRTSSSSTPTTSLLDGKSTEEVIMPDLSDLAYYQSLSSSYVDTKAKFADGSNNPGYGQGAYVDVWNSSTNSYQRITTNGVLSGTGTIIGTSSKPIRVHGPVTFTQDCVIKGYVAGQGTIYTGRNVHVVGSVRYSNQNLAGMDVGAPDFRGSSMSAIDNANEKRSFLGLAARGSVVMGKTTAFTDSYPLQYMTPPFTKGRYDENGNWIPPYNAKEVDSTGKKRYQSTISDATMNSIAEGINQIDAILYTNFIGGGNIGTGGGGVVMNGSIICKDEAMVVFSLPMYMNYDTRIRERSLTNSPLIDLTLPRSPTLLRSTWQDRGFMFNMAYGSSTGASN
ncbi:MAG: hypothetical protein HZC36_00205 [Armatimonadetes bacterium]|nr:hypothetical protein [Armatimonadota bacterium]